MPDNEYNYWPVIADAFIGVLAVVVYMFTSVETADPAIDQFLQEIEQRLTQDEARGVLQRHDVGRASVRIVYSADSLSFERCQWFLREGNAEIIRGHLQLFANRAELIDRVQIEGHADQDAAANCAKLTPFADNLQLSGNRARAVFNALLGLDTAHPKLDEFLNDPLHKVSQSGVPYLAKLTREGRVQVAGFGSTVPMNVSSREDPINRRVEIKIYLRETP